ncbi:MAG TPA: alpha/beta hydrolase family protein [Anaerohalosphaeraceae bacterium]|nr:alpha/beta hydrolase family protein [Anaerohalosphaeraceae bacterium]HOL32029.1 alpha/beta hydrolase family protein [Anaerohalosphaeraceae bacterium]
MDRTSLMVAVVLAGCSMGPNPAVKTPPVDQLPVLSTLPDPFIMQNGSHVKTVSDWQRRRDELKILFAYYEYGHMPPAPGNVTAKIQSEKVSESGAIQRHVILTMGPQESIAVNVGIVIPPGTGPFPVIIRNDYGIFRIPQELLQRGYMLVDYNRHDFDPDKDGVAGPAQSAYPDYDWATLAVWAWGGMRVIDYLTTLDYVDKDKLIFTGHSRGGKAALLAGAMDERIALTVPNGSGCGGAGCFRLQGQTCETLEKITDPKRFGYWFVPRFREFADRENLLPFDQHLLRALVAPRGLLSTDSVDDLWANPYGTQQSYLAAQPVFEWLGVPENQGIWFRRGPHDQNEEDWQALVDFADMLFFGKAPQQERRFDQLAFEPDQSLVQNPFKKPSARGKK